MDSLCKLIWSALVGLFRSRASLQAENLVLRHQLNVLRRKSPRRITSSAIDRLLFVGLYALVPSVLDALQIVKPDTVSGAGNRHPRAVGQEPELRFVSLFTR